MVTLATRPHVDPKTVKRALEVLDRPTALVLNPLAQLPVMASHEDAGELRGLLIDVAFELADSHSPRDAEAGCLLVDYYIKRVGSHEVVMQRHHLTRPTYFRRLKHGYALVALQLNRLSEFALWFRL